MSDERASGRSRHRRGYVWYALAAVVVLGLLFISRMLDRSAVDDDGPLTGSAADPIQDFIRERMQPASGAFFAPSPMRRGQPSEAVLEISPPAIRPEQLEFDLRARAAQSGVSASDSIKIASRMIARLVGDRKATISAKDELDRAVSFNERVFWRWTVTPESNETLTLTAILIAPVVIDGKETGYAVKSFEKTVVVTVTTADRFKDGVDWASEHWVPLTAIGAGFAAVFRWVWSRRHRRRTGFGTS